MTTAITKFVRSAALAALIGASSLMVSTGANALTTINIGSLNNTNYAYGDLDLASDDAFIFEGFVKGTGSVSVNTFVSSSYSSAVAAINVLLAAVKGTGTVSGSWGANPIAFTFLNNSWTALGSVSFPSTGVGGAQLLTINYSGFKKIGQFSANISAVPVPGAAFLLLSGLGGLGFLARRRKAVKV